MLLMPMVVMAIVGTWWYEKENVRLQ